MRAAVSTAASVLYLLTWCAGALVRQCGRCWRTTHTTCVCARERRRSVATRWSSEERTATVVPPTPATRTTSECLMVSSDRQTDRRTDASLVLVAACCEVRCSLKVAHTRLPSVWFRSCMIPDLCSQPAGDVSHKPGSRLPLLSARPAVTPAPLRGLLPVSLLVEQRHDGYEQFA